MSNQRILKNISGRLSLRAPQEESLQALAQALETAPDILHSQRDLDDLLGKLSAQFPTLSDFERDFPSLCFALATGVGKTRLMGAFVAYLYLAYGVRNFFVLAPNLTIYNKLIEDFDNPASPKYVFKGMTEFVLNRPIVITGDNYEHRGAQLSTDMFGQTQEIRINIFNIAKITSESRGGKAPRIKRMSEYLGDSYFNYLAELDDLVLLMDESHRYRASAGMRAINELKPRLGLELTATPFTESSKGSVPFKNVVVDYPLARAMDDGFVKEPAVATQRNFNASQYTPEALERIKLEDGIRLHEATKLDLFTYAKQQGVKQVKPFMLVIARDTTHAANLKELIETQLFAGRYKDKVIQVDSSSSEDETIARLLAVESVDEPTEIVIHVNMLKEGWDVTNLYTIVPLRAANARTLIEQSIGRGLRLPYGKRTGVEAVDRLTIVAHDRFQEIVNEANNPNNPLRMKQVILEAGDSAEKRDSVQVSSNLDGLISGQYLQSARGETYSPHPKVEEATPIFNGETERQVAQVALHVLQMYQHQPQIAPTTQALSRADIQQQVYQAVSEKLQGQQQSLLEEEEHFQLEEVIAKTTQLLISQTIDIPRILVQPIGEVTYGYQPFSVDLSGLNLNPSNRDLVLQSLQTNQQSTLAAEQSRKYERLEDYIVEHLVDFDDISYDEHGELIYDLVGQVVRYFKEAKSFSEDELNNIFFGFAKQIAANIHAQMAEHFWQKATGYEVKITAGFMLLKQPTFSFDGKQIHNLYDTVADKSKIKSMLFGGFSKCLYPVQKFDSDTERTFAKMLERQAIKWFKPVAGQFQIFYKDGVEHREYLPDFVAEFADCIVMAETKARNEMTDAIVLAKKEAAEKWCQQATEHALKHGGKTWLYKLIAHDEVQEQFDILNYR
jgi:type III restriction enzyme